MHAGMMVMAAAGCALVGVLFAKGPGERDWESTVMAMLFAGMAGALIATAAG